MAKDKTVGTAMKDAAEDLMDAAIDTLAEERLTEEQKRRAIQDTYIQQLNDTEPAVAVRVERPKDIWTIDRMKKKLPTWADIYEDGMFMVLFMPLLGDTYCQERYALAQDVTDGVPGAYMKLQIAYGEIVLYCVEPAGCSWPLMETETDEDGNDLLDEDGQVKMHPLPRTWESIERFDMELLILFLNAFQRAISGEVSGKR